MISVSKVYDCTIVWNDEPTEQKEATIAIGTAEEPFTDRETAFDEGVMFYADSEDSFRKLFNDNNGEDFKVVKATERK